MSTRRIGDFSPAQLRAAAEVVAKELKIFDDDKPLTLHQRDAILDEIERIGKIGAIYYVALRFV